MVSSEKRTVKRTWYADSMVRITKQWDESCGWDGRGKCNFVLLRWCGFSGAEQNKLILLPIGWATQKPFSNFGQLCRRGRWRNASQKVYQLTPSWGQYFEESQHDTRRWSVIKWAFKKNTVHIEIISTMYSTRWILLFNWSFIFCYICNVFSNAKR